MQAFSSAAVAILALYVADQIFNAGRYCDVVLGALRWAGLLVGIHG
jgi:hypothetical protein